MWLGLVASRVAFVEKRISVRSQDGRFKGTTAKRYGTIAHAHECCSRGVPSQSVAQQRGDAKRPTSSVTHLFLVCFCRRLSSTKDLFPLGSLHCSDKLNWNHGCVGSFPTGSEYRWNRSHGFCIPQGKQNHHPTALANLRCRNIFFPSIHINVEEIDNRIFSSICKFTSFVDPPCPYFLHRSWDRFTRHSSVRPRI